MTASAPSPLRLYLLQVATDTVSIGDRSVSMSAGCYLVQTGDGRNILIDTGIPRDYAPPGAQIQHGKDVIAHLADLGIAPEQIDTVICTHFDIDHAGHHQAFPRAEFIVQRRHLEAAAQGGTRFDVSRSYWDRPELRYREVDGDTELLPGLRLIETSGHVAGHQSVLVELPETGPVLLAIDAVPMASLFSRERIITPMDDDAEGALASTAKLLDLAERERVALTVFHHDAAQWASLRTAPEWYD